MIKHKLRHILLASLLGVTVHAQISTADVVRIPVGEQANNQTSIDMPIKGMSKEQVKALFGEPLEEFIARGQPPITRWKYQEFTVYFDGNSVIHCVRNFQPAVNSPRTTPADVN
jgi:hypothetical protein